MPKATIEIEPTRSWEVAMEKFVRQQNILFFRKQLAETPHEARRLQILKLLAEEEAKNQYPSKQETECRLSA